MVKVGTIDIFSHGVSSWQKKESKRLANTAAKKKAVEEYRKRRKDVDDACLQASLAAYRRQISREIGRKLTRAEKREYRQKFLAKGN